jgi:hypothetical protein
VGRRILPGLLVALAAIADSSGAHHLAFDALVLAVPLAAVAGLGAFGDYLDSRGDAVAGLQAALWGVSVALLVLSCAVRSHALHGVPPLAVSSVVACLGVYAVKVVVASAPHARRLGLLRPLKP